jgi:oligoendopeptidase F
MIDKGVLRVMSEQTMKKTLQKRSDISVQDQWKLEDMFPSNEAWEQTYAQVKDLLSLMAQFQGRLGESASQLYECLLLKDKIGQHMIRVYGYARMRRDEDNNVSIYQAMTDRAYSLYVEVESVLSFMAPEILAIPEMELERFFSNEPKLSMYRRALDEFTRQREHVLSAAEEQIIAQAGELAHAPEAIFNMFNHADLKFPKITDADGEEVELTHGRFIQFMESADQRVRRDAFQAVYQTYGKYKNMLAASLNSNVKKNLFYSRVRKYGSALEMALSEDEIPVDVYHNLIETMNRNLDKMHRYMSLRKKALGVGELHMYDVYVPIVKDVDMKIPYEKAKSMVAEGLRPLGEEYLQVLQRSYESRWIDVYENEGKTSGAYSWGVYGTHPNVLLNYKPSIDHVFTLAHEMGHALHSHYTNETQPYVYAGYKIFVAEVASTLNETLLMHHLLKTTEHPKEKMYIINHYLESFRTTVFRQTMFAEFERTIHQKAELGEALTPDVLCETYRELNAKYYGPDMVNDDEIANEWMRIPHFYRSFYVFQYATGFSAATSLAKQILEEGEPAVQRYLEFLRSGNAAGPVELLRKAGVDMASPQPVQDALDVFEDLVAQMEKLLDS